MQASHSAAPAVALVTIEYPPFIGGVAVSTQRLARTLKDAGYDVHVIMPLFGSSRAAIRRQTEECTVHEMPLDVNGGLQRASLRFLERLKRLDREISFSIFHSFFLLTVFPCVMLARGRRPVLISIRGGESAGLRHPAMRAAATQALQHATWITSVNETYLRQMEALASIEDRSSVLRCGVEPMPSSLHWSLDRCQRAEVGMVGQFRKVKDLPLLVRSFSALPADFEPQPRLHLLGGMPDLREKEWSRTLAQELGSAERIVSHGELTRREVLARVSRLHVYVQCSAYEGLPNALLEAAACGVPLVATAVGGMKEILRDGENALLVPHGEPKALTAALHRLLNDDELAQRLSDGSRRLAEEWSTQREASAWLELYQRLLETA